MDVLPSSLSSDTLRKLAGSLTVLVLTVAARALLIHALRRRVTAPELRRRWRASIHNTLFVLFVLAQISIWAATIQTFFVSAIAIAVALVIGTKELLMCVLGSIVRVTGDSYTLGDRVEIGTHRGDVVAHNMLTTVLLELGSGTASQQHTGRTVTLPNSVLLTTAVTKESSETPYSFHVFVVPVRRDGKLDERVRTLLDAANTVCAPFLEDARLRWKRLATLYDVTESSPEPHVAIQLSVPDQADLTVRIPSPTGDQASLQEAILRRFFAEHPQAQDSRTADS